MMIKSIHICSNAKPFNAPNSKRKMFILVKSKIDEKHDNEKLLDDVEKKRRTVLFLFFKVLRLSFLLAQKKPFMYTTFDAN